VRSLIGILTTLATVMHFTFGCCLHPCHVAGHGERLTVASAMADACCHDHAGGRATTSDTDHGGHRGGIDGAGLSASDRCDDCDGCRGCDCAALSTEARPNAPWGALAPAPAAVGAERPRVIVPAAGWMPPTDRHGHRGRGRPALFERLSI